MKDFGGPITHLFAFLVAHTAHAAWYFDVITEGQIQNAYFAGWNSSDCLQIRTHASKTVKLPRIVMTMGNLWRQVCIKGRNDNKEFKGNKEMAAKEGAQS